MRVSANLGAVHHQTHNDYH